MSLNSKHPTTQLIQNNHQTRDLQLYPSYHKD